MPSTVRCAALFGFVWGARAQHAHSVACTPTLGAAPTPWAGAAAAHRALAALRRQFFWRTSTAQRVFGAPLTRPAATDICKHTLDHWRLYCNYFHSDLPYRIARALEPYSSVLPEVLCVGATPAHFTAALCSLSPCHSRQSVCVFFKKKTQTQKNQRRRYWPASIVTHPRRRCTGGCHSTPPLLRRRHRKFISPRSTRCARV